MTTISDVAKLSGLSKATVSRVINNFSYVSDEKRELVLKAMKELGYIPNPSARKLRGQLTTTIGVIVSRIVNPFFAYLVNAIEQAAYKNGYQVIIFQSSFDRERELAFLNLLKTKQVDGIIMASIENDWSVIEPFTQYGPIVLCNENVANTNVPIIRIDHHEAAYIGTKHLIERGHTKIGYCTGGVFAYEGNDKDRNEGFQRALKEAGLEVVPKWIFVDKLNIDAGEEVIKQIVEMEDRPTAIFTGSDEVAAGMIAEAKEHGLRIPDEIAIIGFDDQPLAPLLDPKLTTIRQPVDQMGEKSLEVIVGMLENRISGSQNVNLPFELVVRHTT